MNEYVAVAAVLAVLEESCVGCPGKEMGWCENVCRIYEKMQKIKALDQPSSMTKADVFKTKICSLDIADLADFLDKQGETDFFCDVVPKEICDSLNECVGCSRKWLSLPADAYDGKVW